MRKLLWIGSYMDAQTEDYLKQTIQYRKPSTSLSQRNILDGIEHLLGQSFDCIGAVSLHGFPKDKAIVVPNIVVKRLDGSCCRLVGFLNLVYINKLFSATAMKRAAKQWAKQNHCNDGLDVFVYEVRSACLATAMLLKKMIPDTKIHLIVPDIPQYMDLHMNKVKRALKQLDWMLIKNDLQFVDDCILYADAMAEVLGVQDKPWIRMEGSIALRQTTNIPMEHQAHANPEKCIIMYSGSINKKFGLEKLIRAMGQLDDSYLLCLTGSGPDAQTVEAAAQGMDNVKYLGFLQDQTEVMRLQSMASALINMRDPAEEASKYCFPSKLFEYMISGKPVLSCRLEGIPEEYFDYLIPMNSIQPEDIAAAIRQVASKTPQECAQIGERGKRFIEEKKNNIAQARRIIDFTLR